LKIWRLLSDQISFLLNCFW